MSTSLIHKTFPLGLHWPTLDPFLFCAHHHDAYPRANDELGPEGGLDGRPLGQDFEPREGWRMYHGESVPGFPAHPHRGFETVTMVRSGAVDHADSLGAAGRYGAGDVQWMTAGKGIQHSEMFPLLSRDTENPTELFQVWVNLPARSKMVDPHFSMFWRDEVPVQVITDEAGHESRVEVIAGDFETAVAPEPPPDSWAADPASALQIWLLELSPGASLTLPPGGAEQRRMLYFHEGEGELGIGEETLDVNQGALLSPDQPLPLHNRSGTAARLLLLGGCPLNEPVAQHGPFVMNSRAELQRAFEDFQRTGFGGWPWPRRDQVHAPDKGRFALFADGRESFPGD